ncbi:hypothetical protein [Pseudodesulfovibrio tunisiensis]|uniref:hypothetical protein n=1 Tax=Pseudodesulfovibrio tunisiensis TaxID=463192 RepID=UPI001FB42B63|nr:hypothetical protein [Pseudodesulfovibrio tunisiensis]
MFLNAHQMEEAQAMGWNVDRTFSVAVTDVWITGQAQVSVGRHLQALCVAYGLSFAHMRERLTQEMYWHEDSGNLGIMLRLQGADIESFYAEIPSGQWGFREVRQATH